MIRELEHHSADKGGEEAPIQKPHIAIAGASGRFGRMLQAIGQKDYEITSLQHKRAIPNPDTAREIVSNFDITDAESVNKIIEKLARNGVVSIFNCAGLVTVDASEKERANTNGSMYLTHVLGAQNLAAACREFGVKLIHLSTEYVFDGRKQFGEKYKEDEHPDTDFNSAPTWYGLTKALAEEKVLETYPEGSVIARLSQVQGQVGGLFKATLNALEKDLPFTRVSNQLVSPILDSTVVKALNLIERKTQSGKASSIYHLSATDAFTSYQVCLMLADAYGLGEKARDLITPVTLESLVAKGEQGVIRPKNSILDVAKFEKEFGTGILRPTMDEIARYRNLYH